MTFFFDRYYTKQIEALELRNSRNKCDRKKLEI